MSGNRMARQLLCGIAALVACAPVAHAAEGGAAKVAETFEVGRNVFVRSLAMEEATDTLWVGTSAGVLEIDAKSRAVRNTFTREQGLANEYVFAIGIDSQGYKWFGTNAGGVSRYRNGKWKTYFPLHGLADYWIYSFAERGKGDFWIGTWAGASRVDLKTGKFRNYVKELINEWVYGLSVDAKDRVWFGTEGGVSMLDGDKWTHWTHKEGLGAPNAGNLPHSKNSGLGTRSRHDLSTSVEGTESYNPNYVFAVLAAPDGSVWAGTWGGGAGRYDGAAWRNYTTADGLAGNIVYSIAREPGGAMWFGTNRGASRFDGTKWTRFTHPEGLAGDDVYAIAVAKNGDVWLGTKGGVARVAAP